MGQFESSITSVDGAEVLDTVEDDEVEETMDVVVGLTVVVGVVTGVVGVVTVVVGVVTGVVVEVEG